MIIRPRIGVPLAVLLFLTAPAFFLTRWWIFSVSFFVFGLCVLAASYKYKKAALVMVVIGSLLFVGGLHALFGWLAAEILS